MSPGPTPRRLAGYPPVVDGPSKPKAPDPADDGATPDISLSDLIDRVRAIVYVDVPEPAAASGHRTIYLSRGVEGVLGYEPHEILQDAGQWLRIVHPDDVDALIERTRRHLAEPSTLSSEYRLVHRDGRILTVRDDCTSTIDPATGRISSRGVITDITELRESQASFQAFLERLPIVAYSEMPKSEVPFLYIGPEVETLTGYPPADFLADDRLFERLVHPADRRNQLEGYGVAGLPYLAEYRLVHRDGRTIWVRDRAVTELDESGAVIAIHGFLVDITAERESAAALAEAGDRFQRLVENLPLVTYVALAEPTESNDQVVLYVSPQVETMLGYRPEVLTADPAFFRGLVHADDVERVYAAWLADPRAPSLTDYRLIAADGRVIWVRDITTTVPGRPGEPDLRQGTLTDITEARNAQDALAAAEERYRTLIERLPLVTYVDRLADRIRGDNRSTFLSPQVERLLGRTPDDFRDDPSLWRRMVHPDDVDRAYVHYEPGQSGEDILEYRMIRADGETIWVREGTSIVSDAPGETSLVQGYIVDITEAKRANEALVRAQKLEGLGGLAGGIAHDFNNLLVSILGNAELALLDVSPDETDVRDSIVQVEVAARRAADLCRQLLAYSGGGQFIVEPLSVNGLVTEIVDLLRIAIGKGVALTLRLGDDVPAVEADATQLRQVVLNIVVNASDAIGAADGQITITTARTALHASDIAALHGATEMTPGEYVTIDISDTGTGMDQETLRRIFDPFFTTKFAGRGLGLAAVLGIVSGHRGGIAVESERGRGSRFRIHLPPTGRPVRTEVGPMPSTERRTGRILVVDDEPSVRAVARRMLERVGWSVEEVSSGLEAVDRITRGREGAPAIDAVLLDLTMPVLDGHGALVRIRQLSDTLPVVLMSGYAESDARGRSRNGGPAGFVQKPFTPSELTTAIDEALAAGANR